MILEGSFNRLLSKMKDHDFAIIAAYKNMLSKNENIKRNRKLRKILNDQKIGVYQLVGYWLDAPDGQEHKKSDPKEPTDVVERSYVLVKPDDISYQDFERIVVELLTIDDATQGCGLIHKNSDAYFLLYADGSIEEIGNELTINEIAKTYSESVINKNTSATFVFAGLETPDSISGHLIYEKNRIRYCR